MRYHKRVRCLHWLMLIVILTASACGNDLPPEPSRGVISGTVFYSGQDADALVRPVLQVAAVATWPPQGPPHSAQVIEHPDFDGGQAYTLELVPPYDYFIIAQILEKGVADRAGAPAGAFPDLCDLAHDGSRVRVTHERQHLRNVDLTVYDDGGAADPCYTPASTDHCPQSGLAALQLNVSTGIDSSGVSPDDAFVFGLFSAWPPAAPPAQYGLLSGDSIEDTMTYLRNDVPPGAWIVYVCLDRGGDNIQGACGDEDSWLLLHDGLPISFDADTITTIDVDLPGQGDTTPMVETSDDAGCGDELPPGSIAVTITSDSLVIGPNDTVTARIFTHFPIVEAPIGFVEADDPDSFPVEILVEDLEPGEFYVSACFDNNGDDLACNGIGDVWFWFDEGRTSTTVRSGTTTEVAISLDEPAPPTAFEVTLTSTQITAEPDDTVSVALFDALPPSGPPKGFALEDLTGFPTTLTVANVNPGTYFLTGCYDRGGDNLMCDGEGDISVTYLDGAEASPIAEGETIQIALDLDQ